jgi:hypothetical protein
MQAAGGQRDFKSSHFIEALRDAIDINKPGDVLVVVEMSKERKLAQRAFCERCLWEDTRDHLYRNGLAWDLVCGWADNIECLKKKSRRSKKKNIYIDIINGLIVRGKQKVWKKTKTEFVLTLRHRTLQNPFRARVSTASLDEKFGQMIWDCGNHFGWSFDEQAALWRQNGGTSDAYRLRKFSSEKGSASLEILLTLDLPRAMMREEGEPSEERVDEGGSWAFESDPPCSSVGSVGIGRIYMIVRLAYGQPQCWTQVVK